MNLFTNILSYCEEKGLDPFKYIPFTIVMQYDSSFYDIQKESFNKIFNNIKEYLYPNPNPDTKFKKYSELFPIATYGKIGSKTNCYIPNDHFVGKNFWIVKAVDLNRGRCIRIADSIQRVFKLVKKFYDGIYKEFKECEEEDTNQNDSVIVKENKNEKNEENKKEKEKEKEKRYNDTFKKYRSSSILVQKYIEKPLLYYGRKFDIRMWVLVTHKMEVYAFREGHLKTSSVDYNINVKDSFVHLTNYSVQKYNNNFSKFEIGNEVSFDDFQNCLNKDYKEKKFNVKTDLIEKMNELITISMKSVANKINMNSRKNCFELFGYDFIMDSNFNLYILEINTNPGIDDSSPLIKKIIPRMIDDAFRLTIDDLFETKYSWEDYVKDLSNKENNNNNNINNNEK